MGFFSAIKSIFSAPKVIDTATDLAKSAANGIDVLFFTDEEKEQYRQQAFDKWLTLYDKIANESATRSITRRILAVMILGEFLFFLLLAGLIYPWFPQWTSTLLGLAKQLGNLVLAVAVFYFGPYAIGQYIKKDK
jgi:hypothetical protein